MIDWKLLGTAAVIMFIAVCIALLLAGAIENATKPVPGWVPSSSPTTSKN